MFKLSTSVATDHKASLTFHLLSYAKEIDKQTGVASGVLLRRALSESLAVAAAGLPCRRAFIPTTQTTSSMARPRVQVDAMTHDN